MSTNITINTCGVTNCDTVRIHRTTLTTDGVTSLFTVTHLLNEKYVSAVLYYPESFGGYQVSPGDITITPIDNNSFTVNAGTSIIGVWNIVVMG